LTGVKIKQPLELHDNVDTINSSGAKVSIYKNTQASYELRLIQILLISVCCIQFFLYKKATH